MKIDAEATKKYGHPVYKDDVVKAEPKPEPKKAQKKVSHDEDSEKSEAKNDFLRDE